MTAFIIWLVIATFFVALGIFCYVSKSAKAFGFWANAEVFAVKDGKLREYNKGINHSSIFFFIFLPLFFSERSPVRSGQPHRGSFN